ncbi:hypothetical protein ACF0H5_010326 [Mactra antiquata]
MWGRMFTKTTLLYLCIICNLYNVLESVDTDNKHVIEVVDENTNVDEVVGKIQGEISTFERYVKLFEHNRAIQIDAVKSLQKSKMKHEQKYRLTQMMVTDLFKVLEQAKDNLTQWGYLPGDPMPDNDTVRDAITKVFENTAMFGDLILRLPDMTHSIYDKNKHWEFLIGWAVWFSSESRVFKGAHHTLLNLMSQELGLIPKEEGFHNPFRDREDISVIDEIDKELESRKKKEHTAKIKKKSAETKAKRKGPKLSGSRHTEL